MKTSRRKFLKIAGISYLTAGSMQLLNSSKSIAKSSKENDSSKFEIGITSYGLRALSLDQMIEAMKNFEIKKVCIKSHHLPLESNDEEIRNTIAKIENAGLDPYACGVIYMKTKQEVDRAFHYAKVARFKMIVGVPNYELLDYVEEKVKQNDIVIAIHNHGPDNLPYASPREILSRVKDRDDRLGMCMDVAHVHRSGIDIVEAIHESSDRLYDLHLRDNTEPTPQGICARPGKGTLNFPQIIKSLREVNYKGVYTIEYSLEKDNPIPGTAETVGYLRGVNDALK